MTTTYRRRTAGRGSRVASSKRSAAHAVPELRRLVQLGASILLFLVVFIGRGVLPEQVETLRSALCADMDLGGAVAAFGQTFSEGGDLSAALEVFWSGVTGTGAQDAAVDQPEPGRQHIDLPTPREQMRDPSFRDLPSLNGSGFDRTAEETSDAAQGGGADETAAVEPVPSDEPVVTAVAQLYSEDGEELPKNVSFQYYPLGLSETVLPVVGRVTSGFGYRDHPVSGAYSFHTAQDIGVKRGTDVLAFAAGTVRYIGKDDIYGLYVRLDHDNGVSTFYAHCQELLVHKGDTVECGQTIAKSGATGNATGPHLHFSIDKDGIRLDPAWYLDEPT